MPITPHSLHAPSTPPAPEPTGIEHGGNLGAAAKRFAIPIERWIDLSTGINPLGYPIPSVPADAWRRLPDDNDGLAELAAGFFGSPTALPVAGSQAAIRAIPVLLAPGIVAIADLTYGEYAPAFLRAGHEVRRFVYRDVGAAAESAVEIEVDAGAASTAASTATSTATSAPSSLASTFVLDADACLPDDLRYLVIVNPNNPTTDCFSASTLLKWRDTLAARNGMLIVDEAFMDPLTDSPLDTEMNQSLAAHCGTPGLTVLRSIGKFFGLAGIRAGFVLGEARLLAELSDYLGAWTLSGPSRHVLHHALRDTAWQASTRARLRQDSACLHTSLERYGLVVRATPLFAWFAHPDAAAIQAHLARHAIWTRLFATPTASAGMLPSLRIGLPADAEERDRLEQALHTGERLLRLQ